MLETGVKGEVSPPTWDGAQHTVRGNIAQYLEPDLPKFVKLKGAHALLTVPVSSLWVGEHKWIQFSILQGPGVVAVQAALTCSIAIGAKESL